MLVSIFLCFDNQNINSNTKYICIIYTNNNNTDWCSNYYFGKNNNNTDWCSNYYFGKNI